jgi:hypothetical protein
MYEAHHPHRLPKNLRKRWTEERTIEKGAHTELLVVSKVFEERSTGLDWTGLDWTGLDCWTAGLLDWVH